MRIGKLRGAIKKHRRLTGWLAAALIVVSWLLLYKLGSLVGGLSRNEITAATAPVGWHGIYNQPLDLPLKLVRSAVFAVFPDHGQTLTRLPNAVFGLLAIISFGGLIRLWHGRRTAVLATLLFAAGAWTLHAGRLASFDVLYLWATPTLICSHYLLKKYYQQPLVWYGNVIVWGLLLYIPGLVWFVLADIVMQRKLLLTGWRYHARWWQRVFIVLLSAAWLPLLVLDLTRSSQLMTWLGLPAHFAPSLTILKHFAAVPLHLFVRGPQYPEMWLGKAPILDVFTLLLCLLGIYFYAMNPRASRSRYLAVLALLGFVLVGLGGPVALSLLVPLLYVAAAAGIAYLLRDWLKTFPNNPLARGLGIGLVVCAVALSCLYNYRAYFIAWPHSAVTKTIFRYHRQP
jgi:hypothetical protein